MERPNPAEEKNTGIIGFYFNAMRHLAEKMELAALHGRAAELEAKHARIAEEEALYFATHDPKTRALNWHGLETKLQTLKDPKAILYVDGTNIKKINDTEGHTAGDEAIKNIYHVLLGSVRGSDVVARVGGDEFVIVLDGNESPIGQISVGKERRKRQEPSEMILAAKDAIAERAKQHIFDLSIGATEWDGVEPFNEAMDRAEKAMYEHKDEQHKNDGSWRAA